MAKPRKLPEIQTIIYQRWRIPLNLLSLFLPRRKRSTPLLNKDPQSFNSYQVTKNRSSSNIRSTAGALPKYLRRESRHLLPLYLSIFYHTASRPHQNLHGAQLQAPRRWQKSADASQLDLRDIPQVLRRAGLGLAGEGEQGAEVRRLPRSKGEDITHRGEGHFGEAQREDGLERGQLWR